MGVGVGVRGMVRVDFYGGRSGGEGYGEGGFLWG